MRPQLGQVINNKYRLLRLIGDGGMGSVYEARHEVLSTSVALKFLHPELARRSGLIQRFMQEARVSAQIQSDHVVRVTDVDQAAGSAFIVMEYIEGRTLQALYEELYRGGKRLSYEDALEFTIQILDGVEAAHETGIVHRDLKPDNVIIATDARGRPVLKLLDFGIAKLRVDRDYEGQAPGLTRPGTVMGTPEYMAPEQAYSAESVDARADIFSLGVMIFEMIGGRRPVGGEDALEIAGAYLAGRVAHLEQLAPGISPDLAAIVHRAMAPLAGARWPTVSELRDAIQPFAIAVRAPSAIFSGTTLSSQSTATPANAVPATSAGLEEARGVAKTLPPDAEASARSRPPGDTTCPAAPPNPSAPSREPTPIGGFAPPDALPASSDVPCAVADNAPEGPEGAPPDAAALAPVAGSMRVTTSAAPFLPDSCGVDGDVPFAAENEAADAGPGPTVHAPPAPAPMASGATSLGAPLFLAPAPEAALELSASDLAPISGTGRLPPIAVAPPPRESLWKTLPVIVLVASAISTMVVAGVYLAHSRATIDDHRETSPRPPPPLVTVASDPPVLALTPSTAPTTSSAPPNVPTHVAPSPSSSVAPRSSAPHQIPRPPQSPLGPGFPRFFPGDLPFGLPFPLPIDARRAPSREPSDPRSPFGDRPNRRLPPADPSFPQDGPRRPWSSPGPRYERPDPQPEWARRRSVFDG